MSSKIRVIVEVELDNSMGWLVSGGDKKSDMNTVLKHVAEINHVTPLELLINSRHLETHSAFLAATSASCMSAIKEKGHCLCCAHYKIPYGHHSQGKPCTCCTDIASQFSESSSSSPVEFPFEDLGYAHHINNDKTE